MDTIASLGERELSDSELQQVVGGTAFHTAGRHEGGEHEHEHHHHHRHHRHHRDYDYWDYDYRWWDGDDYGDEY